MVQIHEEIPANVELLAKVSIAFEVRYTLELTSDGISDFAMVESPVAQPYRKDYDSIEGNHPRDWGKRFNLAKWGMLTASEGSEMLGGVLIAFDSTELTMLEGRNDLALLWDLRVDPDHRGKGIGSALVAAAEKWAIGKSCKELKVETQNINVAACRFYQKTGFDLLEVNHNAYSEQPNEKQLIWAKPLVRNRA